MCRDRADAALSRTALWIGGGPPNGEPIMWFFGSERNIHAPRPAKQAGPLQAERHTLRALRLGAFALIVRLRAHRVLPVNPFLARRRMIRLMKRQTRAGRAKALRYTFAGLLAVCGSFGIVRAQQGGGLSRSEGHTSRLQSPRAISPA